jgi:hypothetical protein
MGGTGSTHGRDKMKEREMREFMQYTRDEIMKCKMVRCAGHIGEIQHPCQIFEKKPMTMWAGFIRLKLYACD